MRNNNNFSELEQIAQQGCAEMERNRAEYQRKIDELEQIAQQGCAEVERNRAEYQRKIDAIAQHALTELDSLRKRINNELAELERSCDGGMDIIGKVEKYNNSEEAE